MATRLKSKQQLNHSIVRTNSYEENKYNQHAAAADGTLLFWTVLFNNIQLF